MTSKGIKTGIALRGMAMGMAEVVPGVSGGTIAFITGIYERLINAIKSVDASFFKLLLGFKLKEAFNHIDGFFLIQLMVGMVLGIVSAVFSVTWMLEEYPPVIWAFFFGLILASAIYVLKQIEKWNIQLVVIVLFATVVSFIIVRSMPSSGSLSLGFVFLSGAIAICALMLPGVSGSFILLLLGMYRYITSTLKNLLTEFSIDGAVVIIVFGLGCLTGMMGFSRILSWTFKNYKYQTLAALSGFMIGSLWKIWPWRNIKQWMNEDGLILEHLTSPLPTKNEKIKILLESNVMPVSYYQDSLTIWCIVSGLFGFILVFLIDRISKN